MDCNPARMAPEGIRWVHSSPVEGALAVVKGGLPLGIFTDPKEDRAVLRAADALGVDLAKVGGQSGPRWDRLPSESASAPVDLILLGTLERCQPLQELAARGRIDPLALTGAWEATLVQVVEQPFPGVARALCIVGSDRRGAIYGAVALAEQLGVSPWHWWSDSPIVSQTEAWIGKGPFRIDSPRVKYRGFFLNDEYPTLTRWVHHTWGEALPGVALYGKDFYAKVFELLLRLRANTLWPAMWNNAFNEDDPGNADLADHYGIVMGTSHQEPMLRSQKEWDRRFKDSLGSWDWTKHRAELEHFWRQGLRRNLALESLITIGLRGADDTEMAGVSAEQRRAMLTEIIAVQRKTIAEETGRPVTATPQVWCLYKEILDDYRAGLRVPDDVTLLWGEDNWGNLRRLPTAQERQRSGGAGIYYHLDYHGGPRSYQWINTSPLGKIQEQMSLAALEGADRLWIVNVGHLKGYELPMEFFLRFAWAPERWDTTSTGRFTRDWAAREFGPDRAALIAGLLEQYTAITGRRKPELLSPETYSLVHYGESETVARAWESLEAQAQAVLEGLPATFRDSFQQVVHFPIRAAALLHRLYRQAGLNRLYARQGRVSTAFHAKAAHELFLQDLALMTWYNGEFAGGKWKHFMDQSHLGYTSWCDPPENTLDAIEFGTWSPLTGLEPGLAVQGCETAWPEAAESDLTLTFDQYGLQVAWIEIFRRGEQGFTFTLEASHPWLVCSQTSGIVDDDLRVFVSVDWNAVPGGRHREGIRVDLGPHQLWIPIVVRFVAAQPGEGFVESGGVVAMEADHYQKIRQFKGAFWERVAPYGHRGCALRTRGPSDFDPAAGSPWLEYRFYLFDSSPALVYFVLGPTLNCYEGGDLSWNWSVDDFPEERTVSVPRDYVAQHHNDDWELVVADNCRTVRRPLGQLGRGWHRLVVRMIEPGVILQRIVIDCGGLQPSYLGPPESPLLTNQDFETGAFL